MNPFSPSKPLTPQQQAGAAAEQFASQWLAARGLIPITHNYHCAYGELDIVAYHEDTLVFIEVRYRKGTSHGGALASVTRHKQRRIAQAAMHYLQTHEVAATVNCRFDVVGVCKNNDEQWQCHWVQGAFEYDDALPL